MTKKKFFKELLSYLYIIIIVFGFKSSIVEPSHIPTGSMLPTNAIGDFVLINKMSYGFKFPFSHFFSDEAWYLTKTSSPERGDIIVFKYPRNLKIRYIKRVIGIPGDEIMVYNNLVILNGKPIKETRIKKELKQYLDLYSKDDPKETLQFWKVHLGDKEFITARNMGQFYHLNQKRVIVPKDHFFVMGDNRDSSSDSRDWGFVPFKYIMGKAMFIWFNMVYPWSSKSFHFRPQRIGTSLL